MENLSIFYPKDTFFGERCFTKLFAYINRFDKFILLFLGKNSFFKSDFYKLLINYLNGLSVEYDIVFVDEEPSTFFIDDLREKYKHKHIDKVISIGGGKVIDAGKAFSCLVCEELPAMDYLDDIGKKEISGRKIPFYAIPTTSGTGSEATKNAVLTNIGENGFKKSVRHNSLLPDLAIVDPLLTLNLPYRQTIYSAFDALTQLLEAFTSTQSDILSDTIAIEGLTKFGKNFEKVLQNGKDIKAREELHIASFLSGVALTNAGLGIVHGMASVIGGLVKIHHGLFCGLSLFAATKANIEKLLRTGSNSEALKKYDLAGRILSNKINNESGLSLLLDKLECWSSFLNFESYNTILNIDNHFEDIILKSSNRNNPVFLDKTEIENILENLFSYSYL